MDRLTVCARRVCPGRYTADNTVWAAMALILSVFKITRARGEQGEEIAFEPSFSYGVTTYVQVVSSLACSRPCLG